MQIKKLLAGSLAAITAGATIAMGAFAIDSLGDYVTTSDGSLTSPIIVIGAPASPSSAFAKDVLGAADIAAAVAGYATTPVTVSGGAVVTVSNGISLDTANTKIRYGDNIHNAKDMLTSSDLSTVLATGSVTDKQGNDYDYNQYIDVKTSVTTAAVDFGTSGNDLTSAVPIIPIGTTNSDLLYTMKITFSPALDTTSDKVDGKAITLFGSDYTLGSGTELSNTTLTMFGGGTSVGIAMGDSSDVAVGSGSYNVEVVGISTGGTVATLSVDGGEFLTASAGDYITLAPGVQAYIKTVSLFGTGETGSVTLQAGTDKIVLKNSDYVRKGTASDNAVKGTSVTVTPGGADKISQITVKVYAPSGTEDYIEAGSAFTDPVFGSFKVAFGGLEPALDSTSRDIVELTTSDNLVTMSFTDQNQKAGSLDIASNYWGSSTSGEATLKVQDANDYDYVLVEGANLTLNDYTIINTNGFSHLMQLSSHDISAATTTKTVTFTDTLSGTAYAATMTGGGAGNTSTNFIIDGYTYTVNIVDGTTGSEVFNVTDSVTGIRVYPTLTLSGGEALAIIENVTLASATMTVQLPGSLDTTAAYNVALGDAGDYTAGQLVYTWDNATKKLSLNGSTGVLPSGKAAVVVVEEKDAASVRNAITQVAEVESGTSNKVQVDGTAPAFTGTATSAQKTTDTKVKKYLDLYGTLVTTNTDGQGTVTIAYPDEQVIAKVAIGADPTFSAAAGGEEILSAVKITSPVAKLASEVSSTAPGADLILIGGPCANSLTAAVLGADEQCDNWPYTTGIIKEVTGAFTDGSKALVIAGTTADNTRSLAADAMAGTLAYSN